ncbi:hypothetical protein BH24ACT5_BH24ACT5_23920 [soil metagenome]
MKTRLQSLGLLDRAIRATTDTELDAVVTGLDDDHREALERITGGSVATDELRATATKGRLDGSMESLALVLTDAALADCIEKLGDHADNPTHDELTKVLPGVIDRHGLAMTRVMLASTVAGEAAAAPVIRDLLKHDDVVKLPKETPRRLVPEAERTAAKVDPEREALKAKRAETRRRKQEEAAERRRQSAEARNRL